MARNSDTLIILPTFNEGENITMMLKRNLAVSGADILVVDDNSPDGTARLVETFREGDGRVHLLKRPEKTGLGGAYIDGFKWGIEKGYSFLVEMDADGSHLPEELHLLLSKSENYDLVLGSRWVKGGKVVNWPKRREALSRVGNFYNRMLLGLKTKDSTGGYRVFKASALSDVNFEESEVKGYSFQIDMVRRFKKADKAILEVPITFVEREKGVSKMSREIIFEALINVSKWGVIRGLSREIKRD